MVPGLARLVRSRDYRSALAVPGAGPRHLTVIPALPDDSTGYVFARLREAGGTGVVALADGGGYQLAFMFPASPSRLAVAREDDTLCPVHTGSHVAMLFAYLRESGAVVVLGVPPEVAP